jgi:hypothetical protein
MSTARFHVANLHIGVNIADGTRVSYTKGMPLVKRRARRTNMADVFNFQTSSRARHADYKFLIEIRLGCQEPGQPAGKIKITY